MTRALLFVADPAALETALRRLKHRRCPHCGRRGTLNRHDAIEGNDPDAVDKRKTRGRRAWCSSRGQRGGCGRTVALLFAWVIPRHSVTVCVLERARRHLARGRSIETACRIESFLIAPQTLRRLLGRLRRRRQAGPPGRDPGRATRPGALFPPRGIAAFQLRHQRAFLGG